MGLDRGYDPVQAARANLAAEVLARLRTTRVFVGPQHLLGAGRYCRVPLGQFALSTTLGSGSFNAALVAAGWLLGDQWERVTPFLHVLEWLALGAVVAGLAWFIWRHTGHQPEAPAA